MISLIFYASSQNLNRNQPARSCARALLNIQPNTIVEFPSFNKLETIPITV